MNSIVTITISHNHWRVPSHENALDGWLEGNPSQEERDQAIKDAEAARAAWKPSSEAMDLVKRLRAFVGSRIRLEFWDSCMWMCDEEGPYPVEADCIDVVILNDGEFPQAYIKVAHPTEISTAEGYSPWAYFQQRSDCNYLHAALADLYKISRVISAEVH